MGAYKQAVQEAGDALEDKLNELAHEGNVTAAIFLLKGLRPQKYKDRTETSFKIPNRLEDWPEDARDAFIAQLNEIVADGEQTVDVTGD